MGNEQQMVSVDNSSDKFCCEEDKVAGEHGEERRASKKDDPRVCILTGMSHTGRETGRALGTPLGKEHENTEC